MTEITQELVKELLHYDPDTGIFTHKKRDNKWFTRTRLQMTWNSNFAGKVAGHSRLTHGINYRVITIFDKHHAAHRVAWLYMFGEWPKMQVDHINGDGNDNSIRNLRDVSNEENHRNMKLQSRNKSGCTGVYMHNLLNKWTAQIRNEGKTIHLGVFVDLDDAVKARKEAEQFYKYHSNHGRA